MKEYFEGKIVLVTGGAGSIGSGLVRRLLQFRSVIVRIFDNNESALFDLEHDLLSRKIRTLVGDIRDKNRLRRAIEGADVVFHTAALKHVPLCEYNAFEAVKTNIIGTQNLIDVAMDEAVEKLITISTDKAVKPINVMGATKLLVEKLTISANLYRGKRKTAFSCVRFGNVLGTQGSVIPLFAKQIKNGRPLTMTNSKMTRFVMDLPQAIDLIIEAAKIAQGGEIFISKMPAVQIKDLAVVMKEELAKKYKQPRKPIKIAITGKRVGEKIFEELITEDELENLYENKRMFVVLPQINNRRHKLLNNLPKNFRKSKIKEYSSKSVKLLSKRELKALIKKAGAI